MEDLGRHERPQPLREPPARRRPGERTAQAREPGSGRGGGGKSLDTGSLRLTGPARASGPGRGRGRSPSAHRAIERARRTRILDAPGSVFLSAGSAPSSGRGGGRRPGGGGSRAHHPRATGTGWRPEGVGGGEAARAEAAGKVTSGLGARPPDPRV